MDLLLNIYPEKTSITSKIAALHHFKHKTTACHVLKILKKCLSIRIEQLILNPSSSSNEKYS